MYDVGIGAMFLLQLAYLSVALAIPFSFFATRLKPSALLISGLLMAALFYPLQAHWTWGEGWLSQIGQTSRWSLGCGFVDFAGAGVVHAFGGLVALAGAMVLGRRSDSGEDRPRAATAWISLLGALWLAGGWLAYTGAATYGASGEGNLRIGLILTSTVLAGTGGVLAALLYSGFVARQFSLPVIISGLLAGLVSISGAVAFVSPSIALCIGLFGGLMACFLAPILERRGLSDPLNLIGTHLAGGIWGVLGVGIFADGTYGNGWNQTLINRQPVPLVGILYGGTSQFLAQLVGLVVICTWAFGVSYMLFTVLAKVQKGLENEAAESADGLDATLLGLAPEPTPISVPMPAVPPIVADSVLMDEEPVSLVRPTGAWNGRMPGGM
jgi:Amt family ammonium transporter